LNKQSSSNESKYLIGMDTINEMGDDEEEIKTATILEQAQAFVRDFERSIIELAPTVKGFLLAQGSLKK
jgi:Mg/Co/Ni transporter MgtE